MVTSPVRAAPFAPPVVNQRNARRIGRANDVTVKVDPIDRQIGARLRDLRESRQVTQNALAQMVGIEPADVDRYESGVSPAPVSTVVRIANALGAPAAELIGEWPEGWREAVDELARGGAEGTVDMIAAYSNISDARVRRAFLDLARTIVGAQSRAESEF